MGSFNTRWHGHTPTLSCSGSYSFSVSGTTISVSASGNSRKVFSGSTYVYSIYMYVAVDGSDVGGTWFAGAGGSGSCSGSKDVSPGDHSVSVHYCCRANAGGVCNQGFNDVTVAYDSVHVDNPYSEPTSYWITPTGTIYRPDGNLGYNFGISCGSGGVVDWANAMIVSDQTWSYGKYYGSPSGTAWNISGNTGSGSAGGSGSHTLSLAEATKYRLAMTFSDCHFQWISGDDKPFYTYRKPTVNNSIAINKNPQNANSANSFTISGINQRRWEDNNLEVEFQTRYRIKRGSDAYTGWTSAGNVSTWNRSVSEMRTLVSKAYDGQDITLQMERYNPSGTWESDNKPTVTFKVYYKPRKGVTCANTSYKKNNSSGAAVGKGALVINDNTTTGIYISWNYDTTTSDAGYTQGYRIRLYNTSKVVVKTYYTSSKNYIIPKADIPKMQNTYIDITPYFANDQSSVASSAVAGNYWYFANPVKCDFVVLATKLSKPTITYPVEGSEWINTKFRVCFQLPSDGDKGAELETYHYEDIEVSVNGKVFRMTSNPEGLTSGGVQAAGAFSSTASNLTYTKKIVVAPFKASNFPTASTYQIKVRVKKKYTTVKNNWSPWSDVRTFKVKTATFTPAVGDIIYASHYNDSKKVIDRVRKTYSVAWNTKPSDVARGTEILRTQYPYTNLYSIIVDTKKKVNNYATFDASQTSVKFDSTNAIRENFTQYVELVTAASNESKSDGSGRNYMRIIYDRCNRLI